MNTWAGWACLCMYRITRPPPANQQQPEEQSNRSRTSRDDGWGKSKERGGGQPGIGKGPGVGGDRGGGGKRRKAGYLGPRNGSQCPMTTAHGAGPSNLFPKIAPRAPLPSFNESQDTKQERDPKVRGGGGGGMQCSVEKQTRPYQTRLKIRLQTHQQTQLV